MTFMNAQRYGDLMLDLWEAPDGHVYDSAFQLLPWVVTPETAQYPTLTKHVKTI